MLTGTIELYGTLFFESTAWNSRPLPVPGWKPTRLPARSFTDLMPEDFNQMTAKALTC